MRGLGWWRVLVAFSLFCYFLWPYYSKDCICKDRSDWQMSFQCAWCENMKHEQLQLHFILNIWQVLNYFFFLIIGQLEGNSKLFGLKLFLLRAVGNTQSPMRTALGQGRIMVFTGLKRGIIKKVQKSNILSSYMPTSWLYSDAEAKTLMSPVWNGNKPTPGRSASNSPAPTETLSVWWDFELFVWKT